MKINKYPPHGGIHRPVAESTSTPVPIDPFILEEAFQADADRAALEKAEYDRMTGGYESGSIRSVDPLFDILSFGGPKLLSQIGKAGVKQLSKFLMTTPRSEIAKMPVRDIVVKAINPMDDLAARRAKENLTYASERAIKEAGEENTAGILRLQSQSDDALRQGQIEEAYDRSTFEEGINNIFGQARMDDIIDNQSGFRRIKDVGSVDDVKRMQSLGGYEKADEYAMLFEDLGMDKNDVMRMLEERFMMDKDAVKLPLSAYGKQTKSLNKYGGVVPIKKAKKGMRLIKR